MDEIINYEVVKADSVELLSGVVIELSKFGWKPQGGIAAAAETNSGVMFYQAMVRNETVANVGDVSVKRKKATK